MAHIMMKYILIKKKYGNDNANLSDILREYLESNYNIEPGENTIIIDDCKVQYSFSNNKDDNRCFFTLSSDERIYSNAKCLEHILEDIKRSGLLPYFHFLSVLLSFSKRISELVKPIENNFQESLVNAIKDSALKYSAIDVNAGYKEAMEKLATSFTWYDSTEEINNALEASKKEFERIGNAWKQYEIDAIGTAAKFENLTKQISSINKEEKTDSL